MRALAMIAVATLLAGCPTPKCKDKTVLVTATFDAASRAADALVIVVEVDGNAQPAATVAGPRGKDSGTLQVEFPSGYHAGSTLTVTIAAQSGGQSVATGTASTTLMAGCTVLPITVGAGGTDLDMSMADMLQLPVPVVMSKPDLVGFVTQLDASSSTDPLGASLTFSWAIQQAPAGSAVKTASLTSTTAAKTSFEPDRGGVYKVALTASASDGRTATSVVDVTVPTVPVFYTRTADTATTYSVGARVIASDGTGDRSIGCAFSADGGLTSSTTQAMPFFGHAYDPPTASGTPLFAFFKLVDTMSAPQVVVGNAATDCTNAPPTRVDNNVFNDHIAVSARFSPDGKRIVYVDMPQDQSMATFRLVTVAVDGVGPKHVVRSSGFFGFTPAIWLDNSTVAWLERAGNSTNPFTIWKAPDENAAGDPGANTKRTAVLNCDQSTTASHLAEINQFEMSPFGMIVAGGTSARCLLCNPPLAPVNLYQLAANDCSVTTAKTLVSEPAGGLSWDFALSPDGLNILFSSTHNQAIPDGGSPEPQTDVFLVPSDGTAPAQKLVGDPLYDDISPRFIAQGRQFIWTRTPRNMDMGADAPAIMIANSDGTHVRAFTPGALAGETVRATDVGANRGFDCSWTPGAATSGAATAFVGFAALLLLAFRRRRRR